MAEEELLNPFGRFPPASVLTPPIADTTRDKVIALEVEVAHLRADMKLAQADLRQDIVELTAALKQFQILLEQAKGGRFVLLTMLSTGSFTAGIVAGWIYLWEFFSGGNT